jgi:prevent-host-death family protein
MFAERPPIGCSVRWVEGCLTRDTLAPMTDITMRELRNQGGKVVDRVVAGERFTITRAGKAVAELRPVSPGPLSAEALLQRWRALPLVNPTELRADIDAIVDQAL